MAAAGAVAAISSGNRDHPEEYLDPIEPKCVNCKHILRFHKSKGCTNSALLKGHWNCGCKIFVFDVESFEIDVQSDIETWKEWFDNSKEDQMILKEKTPLVERRLREYQKDAEERTKQPKKPEVEHE